MNLLRFSLSLLALAPGFALSITSIPYSGMNEYNAGCDLYVAGFDKKEEFTDFYRKLRAAMDKGDSAELAKLALYPLNTKLQGKKTEIKDEAEFKKHFKTFFTNDVLKGALLQQPEEILCNKNGVQIGLAGQLWIQVDPTQNRKVGIRTVNP